MQNGCHGFAPLNQLAVGAKGGDATVGFKQSQQHGQPIEALRHRLEVQLMVDADVDGGVVSNLGVQGCGGLRAPFILELDFGVGIDHPAHHG